jgi:hypothetical protein
MLHEIIYMNASPGGGSWLQSFAVLVKMNYYPRKSIAHIVEQKMR